MAAQGRSADEKKRILAAVLVASQHVLRTMTAPESDSDSDDDDISEAACMEARLRLRGSPLKPMDRCEGYVETVLTYQILNAASFKKDFRMHPSSFEKLATKIGHTLSGEREEGRPTIDVNRQLLCVLWLLATPDSYRSVGKKFDMAKSSLGHCCRRVMIALNDIAVDMILWPSGRRLAVVKEKFRQLGNLPDCIGAIDGCHIEIKAPQVHPQYYITRKSRFAITLQAVCDAELRFTDCFVGYAGSVGDLRVFRDSDLWHEVHENPREFFPQHEYIIGDKAYPVLTWCISAYKNVGDLTERQKNFNHAVGKTRQVIERAFGLLKGRWRRLKYLDMNRDDMIPQVILACCVLHNICLDGIEDIEEDFIEDGLMQ